MSSITDLFTEARNITNPVVTTVSTARSIAGTSLVCTSLSGWPNKTVHFITYRKTSAGAIDKSTQCDWKGIVSSNTITTLTLKSGTDAGNSIGDFVEMGPTAAYAQDLAAGLEVSHNVDGTMITGLPLTSPKVTTGINDSNNNEIFKVTATTSAVNEITLANAATGAGPTISATGGDTNVDLNLAPKGTGQIKGVVDHLFNPYKFSVHRTTALNTANNATAVVAYDTKSGGGAYDTSNNVDITTNKGRFTAPVAGYYRFSAYAAIATGGTQTNYIALAKNGSEFKRGEQITFASGTAGLVVNPPLILLAANDYVEVIVFSSATAGFAVGASQAYFGGELVCIG